MSEKKYTCIVCPRGCTVIYRDGEISGNRCLRGKEYVLSEATDPRRNISSTAAVTGSSVPVVPVKTSAPIPKGRIFDCMNQIKALTVAAPVTAGQILIKNVCGLDADIVACGNAEREGTI